MGEALDRRSDLYGVGAMLFELVTGRRMWSGETDLELLRQLALGEPPLLADAAPDAPKALCDLHAHLVSKKASARPDNAADVASALRACMKIDADAARATLVALLSETYGEEAREKKRELDLALAAQDSVEDPRSGEPGAVIAPASAPQKRRDASRAAPWLYALLGAAIASAAVLVVRRETPSPAAAPSATAASTTSTGASATSAIASSTAQTANASDTSPSRDRAATTAPVNVTAIPHAVSRPRTPVVHSAAPAVHAPPDATTAPTTRPAHPEIDVDTHAI